MIDGLPQRSLPSDGRGNSLIRLLHLPERLDTPTDGGRFSLSHPMGEGRGEGECFSESEVVFARVLKSELQLRPDGCWSSTFRLQVRHSGESSPRSEERRV